MDSHPKVLIVGAGLGGLVLAQALRRYGISFEIFERDHDQLSRSQGWAILLQWILKDLITSVRRDMPPLEPVCVTYNIDMDTEFKFYDASPMKLIRRVVGRDAEGNLTSIRANRALFRDWLSTHLDIKWNKHFNRYEEAADGVTIHFDDGSSATGDILVGADGVHSKVRTQLLAPTPPKLSSVRIGMIIGDVELNKEQYEHELKMGPSMYMARGRKYRVFNALKSVSEDKQSAHGYWMFSWPDKDGENHDTFWTTKASQKELLDFALENSKDFDPNLNQLIRLTKLKDIYQPTLHVQDWVPIDLPMGRVTLLGDAVHPMSMFRGEGGNNAMMDGINLANVLNKALAFTESMRVGIKMDVQATLKKYEAEMLERGREAVLKSRKAAEEVDIEHYEFKGSLVS
ncbi:MAG: hypothetical protein MMC33_010454 [Icmadophila ericetorum]|nr:hypothetical protein [Icmadophila ericetorum]